MTGSAGSATLTVFTYSYTNPTTNQQTSLPYSVKDAAARTTSYSYDNGNQLTSAVQKNSTGSQLASYGFGYDPAGNLTSKTVNGTGTSFSYNAANELTSATSGMTRGYSYDGNGNLKSVSGGRRRPGCLGLLIAVKYHGVAGDRAQQQPVRRLAALGGGWHAARW